MRTGFIREIIQHLIDSGAIRSDFTSRSELALSRLFANYAIDAWSMDDAIDAIRTITDEPIDEETMEKIARKVLRLMDRGHDATIGFTWFVLERYVVEELSDRKIPIWRDLGPCEDDFEENDQLDEGFDTAGEGS